ncbi:CBR-NHR-71 protein [Aphelenchoides besseyi]|nr:CBR-NHR-71 protein [Aphelenchoides besseyi]KAI6200984.1 CBR-NHR-71 protein [Aphelenchoides besseyi]
MLISSSCWSRRTFPAKRPIRTVAKIQSTSQEWTKTEVVLPELPSDFSTDTTGAERRSSRLLVDINTRCSVCGAKADGVHYNAVACRSCTAFFRRAVTYKQKYSCRNGNQCSVNMYDRCACRKCRLDACYRAGMSNDAVRPQREPTGSQKRRKKIDRYIKEERESSSSSESEFASNTPRPELNEFFLSNPCQSTGDQAEFDKLVFLYTEHLRFMNRSLITADEFLQQLTNGVKYSVMTPEDVDRLSTVELSGLLYWIESLAPFTQLPADDRDVLFKRYSVRKLSLDHFYHASKHPEYTRAKNFMMNNNRFVDELSTGFEMTGDTELARKAKFRLLRPTIELSLSCVVKPLYEMKITDAEIVFLHLMLMWSNSSMKYVKEETRVTAKFRRNWAINRLFVHFQNNKRTDGIVRLGELILLLGTLEVICNMHVKDVQVAQLFKVDNLDKYQDQCYVPVNIQG